MPTLDTTVAVNFDFVVRQNQTFNPVLTFITDGNDPIDLSAAEIKMSIRQKGGCGCAVPCGINDGPFNIVYKQDFYPTVTGVDNNQLQFNNRIDLAKGMYAYDLLIVWPSGEQQYYLKGKFKVEKSYTDADNN